MVDRPTLIQNDLLQEELESAYQELQSTKQELAATKKKLLATKKKLQTLSHIKQNQGAHEEQLQRLKEDFLSAINHELRSPLSNMKMAIHLLKTASTALERERYLEMIQAMCTKETELITNLLDLQRLEAGSDSEVLVEVVNLHQWLPPLVEPFYNQAQQRGQTLQLDLPREIPPLLQQRVSLKRILSELLNNACKYTSTGGEICLTVRYDQLDFEKSPHPKTHYIAPSASKAKLAPESSSGLSQSTAVTTFTIRNQAEIQPEYLSRIFDKFYRVPQLDRWQQGGMGLGLALVQKLVEHLQGTIQAESNYGWTTFTLCFANWQLE